LLTQEFGLSISKLKIVQTDVDANNYMAQILACPVPTNLNPLSPNGFKFNIEKLGEVEYFCQEVNIPGITIGDPVLANPFRAIPLPGDHLTYDTLNVKFLIDANMENYIAIHNWIVALGFPEEYDQYIDYINTNQFGVLSELAKSYSDATLQILSGANTPVKTLNFRDLVPRSLGSLTFQSTNQDVLYLVGDATFSFSYYTFA
jgi:hypothetical protein